MTRLRLGLNHLRERKFNHHFQNCINPLCSCEMDIESTSPFSALSLFDDKRITFLSTLSKLHSKLIETNEFSLTETLLFGNSLCDLKKRSLILRLKIKILLFPEIRVTRIIFTWAAANLFFLPI